MTRTKRRYNKPNNKFYWHPWQQIQPQKSYDGSRKGYKHYARKVIRCNQKSELVDEINQIKAEFNRIRNDPYHRFKYFMDDHLPSVQYLQDGVRCCLKNQDCPEHLCRVQNSNRQNIKFDNHIEDFITSF